jgi:hypothetical protein
VHRLTTRRLCLFALNWRYCLLLLMFCTVRGENLQAASSDEESLKRFLQDYLDEPGSTDTTIRIQYAFADLAGDGKREAIVYITGSDWCGSGGCTLLVLVPSARSWKVISSISITRPPIRILSSQSNGWHSLAVRVQGGGIQPGYKADLRFNGESYGEPLDTAGETTLWEGARQDTAAGREAGDSPALSGNIEAWS